MRKTRYPSETKEAVLKLGARGGMSYADIQKYFLVPKSTLSTWFKQAGKEPDRTRQLAHLAAARKLSAATLQKQRVARIAEAQSSASNLARILPMEKESVGKSLLAMLYWAEGGKTIGNLKFTNTDPILVALFISLIRKHYPIDESRFRIGLLVHDYHDQKKMKAFWSKKLRIPSSQFWKIYVKPRSGRKKQYRRNFYGICNLHYSSSAIQRELIALGNAIAAQAALKD